MDFYSDRVNLGLLGLTFGGAVTLLFGLPFLHSQPHISLVGGSVTCGSIALLAIKKVSALLKQNNSRPLEGRVSLPPPEDAEDARILAVLEATQNLC